MKTITKALPLFVLAFFLAAGCATTDTPYGTDSAVFSQGKYYVVYPNTLYRTFEAARSALKDLDMTVTNVQKGSGNGKIEAAMANGTNVALELSSLRPDITRVDIKVGSYGDQALSKNIGEKIQDLVKG